MDSPQRDGGPSGYPGQREITGLGLHQIVVAGPSRARPGAAIGRQMNAYDLRIGGGYTGIIEPELGGKIAAQIVENDIAGLDQLEQHLAPFRVFQVERKAALVAVKRFVEMAVARAEKMRPDIAPDVAAVLEVLDLDDFRAEVGKVLGAERARAVLLDRNDAQSGKRKTGHSGFLAMSCLAMMMRCISLVPSPMISSGASRYRRSTLNSLE